VTLIEMMVAVAVFAVVVALGLEMTLVASHNACDTIARSALEGDAEQGALRLAEILSSCTKLWSYADTYYVIFSVPVDQDKCGTVLDKLDPPNIEWGAVTESQVIGGGEIVYFFGGSGATDPETGALGTFKTISEAVEHIDINGDGDMTDTFDVGTVYRRVAGATPQVVPLTAPNVIQRSGTANYGKCIKHDNCTFGCDAGKIFFLDGTNVMHVNLWLLRIPETRRPVLVFAHQKVYLRNQQ
jgi:hypothetical protein